MIASALWSAFYQIVLSVLELNAESEESCCAYIAAIRRYPRSRHALRRGRAALPVVRKKRPVRYYSRAMKRWRARQLHPHLIWAKEGSLRRSPTAAAQHRHLRLASCWHILSTSSLQPRIIQIDSSGLISTSRLLPAISSLYFRALAHFCPSRFDAAGPLKAAI